MKTISEIVEKSKPGVVMVDVQVPSEGNQVKIGIKGTGFIISADGKFITNAHVFRQIQESEMEFAGVSVAAEIDEKGLTRYERFKMEKLEIDDENDVALLKIISDGRNFPIASELENQEAIKEGEEVVFIGYPLAVELLSMGFGITMTTNKCIVSSVKRTITGLLHFFLVDTHINNGSSGSPVFSMETGNIIGIASARVSLAKIQLPGNQMADIPANIGICRPIKYAIDLISKNK